MASRVSHNRLLLIIAVAVVVFPKRGDHAPFEVCLSYHSLPVVRKRPLVSTTAAKHPVFTAQVWLISSMPSMARKGVARNRKKARFRAWLSLGFEPEGESPKATSGSAATKGVQVPPGVPIFPHS